MPELTAFIEAVRSGIPPERGSLEFARDVMAIYEAALRSQSEVAEPSTLRARAATETAT